MKNVFLILICIVLFSCSKNEKKEVPLDNIQSQDTAVVKKTEVLDIDIEDDTLIFMVQIAALSNANETLSILENVHVFNENSLIKYRFGDFKTYEEARSYRKHLIEDYNYKDAFVQALLNDAPITITEALQY